MPKVVDQQGVDTEAVRADMGNPVLTSINTGHTSLMESLMMIGRRYLKTKPTFADTWMIGSEKDISVIERYRTDHSQIIIGKADDGEMEYFLIPDDYDYSVEVMTVLESCISALRERYRKSPIRMDRASIRSFSMEYLKSKKDVLASSMDTEEIPYNELCDIVYRYTFGTGIFELLLEDPRIEDVYVDAPCSTNRIHVTMNCIGGDNSFTRCRTNLIVDDREVVNLINMLMRDSGLPFCESHPVLETNMSDGLARATVVGYPMSPNGDSLAIRKHSSTPWTLTRLIGNGTLDAYTAGLISFLVDNRCTFLICGARGSGKSSLLSAMMFEFPLSQRIITIEDTMELPSERMRAMGYKVQSLLIDDRNEEDANKRADEALRVSLRMGESAIVLGEVRGEETRTLYQSMRVGRAGSSIMGTIHGDSARTVYERVVHDMGIAPESFMATDFLITMGVRREGVSNRQMRGISEFVFTTDRIGEFSDASSEGLFDSPAMRRIMRSSSMERKDVELEISIRAGLRNYLAELAEEKGEGFYRPEWLVMADEHMRSCISSGMRVVDDIVNSFRCKLTEDGPL